MSKDLLETKDMLHGRQERGMEKDMIAREIKVATKNLTFGNLFIQMWMLEGKFAFSSDSVQYIKRLTNRGCVFYALHKLEAWVQLLSAEMILCPYCSNKSWGTPSGKQTVLPHCIFVCTANFKMIWICNILWYRSSLCISWLYLYKKKHKLKLSRLSLVCDQVMELEGSCLDFMLIKPNLDIGRHASSWQRKRQVWI